MRNPQNMYGHMSVGGHEAGHLFYTMCNITVSETFHLIQTSTAK